MSDLMTLDKIKEIQEEHKGKVFDEDEMDIFEYLHKEVRKSYVKGIDIYAFFGNKGFPVPNLIINEDHGRIERTIEIDYLFLKKGQYIGLNKIKVSTLLNRTPSFELCNGVAFITTSDEEGYIKRRALKWNEN